MLLAKFRCGNRKSAVGTENARRKILSTQVAHTRPSSGECARKIQGKGLLELGAVDDIVSLRSIAAITVAGGAAPATDAGYSGGGFTVNAGGASGGTDGLCNAGNSQEDGAEHCRSEQ